jgi:CHASE3 domain sensor protein
LNTLPKSLIEYEATTLMPIFRPTKVRIAFGIALLVLTTAAFLSSWNVSRFMETQRQITEANAVLDRLGDISDALGASVIASRGSVPDAVQLLSQSVESMRSAVRDVRQGTIAKPDQQQRITLLEDSIGAPKARVGQAQRSGYGCAW